MVDYTKQRLVRGHLHVEAFCLMWYQCRDCQHLERIWNSRDGVTPFGLSCPSCGGDGLRHFAFELDEYAPQHQLANYQRFWRDGTPSEAEAIMRRRIESTRPKYPCTPEREAELCVMARQGTTHEFQPGWPTIDVRLPAWKAK